MLDLVGPWFGMNVQHYDTFVASHPSYLVLGNFGALAFLNWLVPELQAEGAHMDLRAVDGERIFFHVGRDRNGHERVADTP
jgi:hypothetical protein